MTTPITATVDENGVYTAAPGQADPAAEAQPGARPVADQRLDSAQQLWLTSYDIERVYAQVSLYYVAPGSRVLVPDLRWFPQTAGLATVIARAQLAEPPPYLRSAVLTGVPANTRLALDSVPTSGSVATVDLNSVAQQTSSSNRAMMWAQLAAAVTQAPGVDSVRVLANGKVLDLPGASVASGASAAALGYVTDVPVSANPVALSAKAGRSLLTQVDAFDSVPAPRATMPALGVALRSVAISVDVREFAGVTTAGTQLVRMIDGKTSVVLTGTDLTAPSYDNRRWLWTASSGPGTPTRLRAALTGPGVVSKDVAASLASPSAPWLAGRQVVALRISRDGTRALVASTRNGQSRVDIAGIVRDSRGRPLSLTTPLLIGAGLSGVVDASWVDPVTVAVLGRAANDAQAEPYLVTIGAENAALPAVPVSAGVPVAISAGDGEGSIALVTSKGQVLNPGGSNGWASVGSVRATGVAFPG